MTQASTLRPLAIAFAALSALGLAGPSACRNSTTDQGASGTSSGASASLDAAISEAQDASAADSAAASEGGAEFRALTGAQTEEFRRLFAEGSAAYSRRDFTAAARSFRQLYELSPNPAMAFNLARVYERMGEVSDALTFFQRVLDGSPPPTDAQRQDIDRRVAALRAYQQRQAAGIAAAPATAQELNQEGVTWFQRGVRLFQQRQYQPALQAFEEAARFLETPELFFNLAMTYERLRNYPRAIEYLRQYLDVRRGTAEEEMIQSRIRDLESR